MTDLCNPNNLLKTRKDFLLFIRVLNANPNGDPLKGNLPRTTNDGYGMITPVCIKRKVRNRMQDLGYPIFVQSEDRATDDFSSLSQRAADQMGGIKDREVYANTACEQWMDVRTFGQVFAFSDNKGVSVGVRGPVSISYALSVAPVTVESAQITKSVNGDNKGKEGMSSDRMGMMHFVPFGVYVVKGSINVLQAEKTGFTEEDAEVVKECLRTLFVNDASSARPAGSMVVEKLFWFDHNCRDGQYSISDVHNSVHLVPIDPEIEPASFADYTIEMDELPGLKVEVLDGE